nr:transcription factor IIIB 90 kDa subunit isoform X2 [Ipomoea batatas]
MFGLQVVERVEVHKNLTAKTPLQMSSGVTKRKRIGGGSATEDQTESLSDIDDSEVAGYLNSKEERHYKKIIWEKINQQFAMVLFYLFLPISSTTHYFVYGIGDFAVEYIC